VKVLSREDAERMRVRRFPVVEMFGPTIQGEGPDAGRPCAFIRFGGCDYECSWCDSLHAVLASEVRKAERLTTEEIISRVVMLVQPPNTIVLSGGNPALHELGDLVEGLQSRGYRVTIETQGTKSKPWIGSCDVIVTSPKPPSSGMVFDAKVYDDFLRALPSLDNVAIKVVVGSDEDYEFARDLREAYWALDHFYLSVLNPSGSDVESFSVAEILHGYRALCERVASDPEMHDVRVMPQLHTLAWGAEQGR
jgi:7-carboxy-7-deazaguanine synthase